MLVADIHFKYLDALREYLVTATSPMQKLAAEPVKLVGNATDHFSNLANLQLENADLRERQLSDAGRLLRFDELEQENAQLRALLGMAHKVPAVSVAAEVLYSSSDPDTRKVMLDKGRRQLPEQVIILDRGRQSSLRHSLAVVDADGLLGQVTRVYPLQSEVTLITDRNLRVPVRVQRNGLLGVTSGIGQGRLELLFVLADADIRPKDRLLTSGLDGVFLSGLPVAEVESVDRESGGPFARVTCRPLGGVERSTRVLVLGRAELPPQLPKPETGDPPLPPPPPMPARPVEED